MRKTLVSLIALATAGAVSATAFAQDAGTTVTTTTTNSTTTAPATAPVATTVVTTTPAPALDATVTTDTTTATTVTTTTVTPVPAPAPAPAAPVVEAPPPPPPAPTDPTTIQVLNVLDNVCKPLVTGGDLQTIAKPLGFKKNRDNSWSLRLEKPYQITVFAPGANKNVCNVEILHAVNGDAPITVGVHNYAIQRGYTLYRNDEFTTDLKRHTRSWELTQNGQTEALVLVTEKNPDGSPVAKNADRSTLMYSAYPAAQ
ncbi:MAG: hypothetical protein ACM3YN_11325 [Parcubacteria group bacterium]